MSTGLGLATISSARSFLLALLDTSKADVREDHSRGGRRRRMPRRRSNHPLIASVDIDEIDERVSKAPTQPELPRSRCEDVTTIEGNTTRRNHRSKL
jgi:hypothetical protein